MLELGNSSANGAAVRKSFQGRELSLTARLLEDRRHELIEQSRSFAPELVDKLELRLEALKEQGPARGEYEGLDRLGAILKFLQKTGRPAALREIRDALAAPVSRFPGRSIWDGGKRAVLQGRLLNVADRSKGEDWILALPKWHQPDWVWLPSAAKATFLAD